MICPFCKNEAKWVDNKEIYGRSYGKSHMAWYCKPCNAYVGCHNNTQRPLGTMANKELREWRIKAHDSFDGLWKSGVYQRRDLYNTLNKLFGRDIHIGESDIETCKKIIEIFSKNKIA